MHDVTITHSSQHLIIKKMLYYNLNTQNTSLLQLHNTTKTNLKNKKFRKIHIIMSVFTTDSFLTINLTVTT